MLLQLDGNHDIDRMYRKSFLEYAKHSVSLKKNVSLCELDKDELDSLDTSQSLLVAVSSKDKSWVVKRSQDDFVGLDRQIHRCLYDRRYSKLPELKDCDEGTKLDENMVQQMQYYLSRFSELAGNNVNCGPILNWLELDNHGNHLVVMEADDSAINVPAVAAGRAIKRYQAQAPDEMSLEVGDFLSVIDMPSSDETIWWRGKKGFEVGFFPSHCIDILNDKEINDQILHHLQSRPVSKRRGKFISFLRFFFKSRPSKDELMQHGILRERVFGCDLGERLALTGRDTPLVLEMCAEIIEEHGIVDGIYRLSGIVTNLQKLRVCFDCDEQPPNLRDMKYLNDIHCISSLLKTYFRELPNPLFTVELYDKFVIAIKKEDDTERTVAFHHVIQRLPPPHYRTMNKLLRHLNYCASHSDSTNMTAKNLAIVWAPNLLRPSCDDSVAALTEFRTQAIIVEYMIRNVDVFFDKNLASAAIAYYPEIQEAKIQEDNECVRVGIQQNNSGPKLISLEEARQRVHQQRELTKSKSLDGAKHSPRHNKLRSAINPPKVSAAPVSPLPTLLSIEEAQARTKSKVLPGLRSDKSSNGSSESREIIGVNSPRRTRKWFGLFSKGGSKSVNVDDEEHALKTSMSLYAKKHSPLLSYPTRSQSEYRLQDLQRHQQQHRDVIVRSESFTSIGSADRKSLTSTTSNPPVMTPDSEFDINVYDSDTDSISLMSAIVSVTAKYINLEDAQRYRSPTKCSFSVGEPTDFRKLDDEELTVKPPSETPVTSLAHEIPVDAPPLAPYSSHRRGAPSNDSGYLSQASTLNRDSSDTFSSVSVPFVFSPERKSLRNSGRTKRDSEDDVPMKRVRSLSPESYSGITEIDGAQVEEDVKNEVNEETPRPSAEINNSNHMNVDELPTREMSPREITPEVPSRPITPDSPDTTPRPSSLNVKARYVNLPELSSSYSSVENIPPVSLDDDVFARAGPNSMLTRLSRSKSVGNGNLTNKISTPLVMQETVFGPPELFYQTEESVKSQVSEVKTISPIKSYAKSTGTTPTKTEFNFTRSRSLSSKSELLRSRFNTEVQTTGSHGDCNTTKKDVPNVVLRSSKSRDSIRSRNDDSRRLSVLEKAALFGDVGAPSSPSTTKSERADIPKNRPISSSSPNKQWDSTSPVRRRENISPRKETNTKATYSENNDPNLTEHVSSKDFDIRCRVSDGLVSRYTSSNEEVSSKVSPRDVISRSTDRLVRSSYRRNGRDFNQHHSRPQSDIIYNFDYRSFDEGDRSDGMHKRRSTESTSSPKTRQPPYHEHFRNLKSSKSDNRLSGSADYGRKLGNFPLTLRSGSAQIPQVTKSDTRASRPRSLYDNERRSYYDNLNTLHYEMV